MANILFNGIGFFGLAVLIQIIFWQLFKVRREMFFLAIIFILAPFVLFVGLFMLGYMDLLEVALTGLLFYSLSSVYVQVYPALREDTPSFRILFAIDETEKSGMSVKQLIQYFASTNLVDQKMTDLAHDGLIQVDQNGKYKLNSAGLFLAKTFALYRKLLGLGIGEG